MHEDETIARARIARLARQLLRHERRAALLADAGTDERAIVASSRRIAIETIASHADRIDDAVLRGQCSALLGLYDAHRRSPGPQTMADIVELLSRIAG